MKILFADKKLEKLANDDRKLIAEMGKRRALLLRRRLTQMTDAANLEDLRKLPGHYHELKGDRKGQWACDLDQPYRLLFTPIPLPISINSLGQKLLIRITQVEIIEITNYH